MGIHEINRCVGDWQGSHVGDHRSFSWIVTEVLWELPFAAEWTSRESHRDLNNHPLKCWCCSPYQLRGDGRAAIEPMSISVNLLTCLTNASRANPPQRFTAVSGHLPQVITGKLLATQMPTM